MVWLWGSCSGPEGSRIQRPWVYSIACVFFLSNVRLLFCEMFHLLIQAVLQRFAIPADSWCRNTSLSLNEKALVVPESFMGRSSSWVSRAVWSTSAFFGVLLASQRTTCLATYTAIAGCWQRWEEPTCALSKFLCRHPQLLPVQTKYLRTTFSWLLLRAPVYGAHPYSLEAAQEVPLSWWQTWVRLLNADPRSHWVNASTRVQLWSIFHATWWSH